MTRFSDQWQRLHADFPFESSWQGRMTSAGKSVGLILVVLLVLQPFGPDYVEIFKTTFLVFGVSLLYFALFRQLRLHYYPIPEKGWTVGKQVLQELGLLVVITSVVILNNLRQSPLPFYELIAYVLVLGTPIIVVRSLLKYENYKRFCLIEAREISDLSAVIEPSEEVLRVIAVEAAENYVVLYRSDGTKEMIRATLKDTAGQYKDLLQCHRSFLIYLGAIEKASGNAQGLKLSLKGTDLVVPVSRAYVKKIREAMA